MKKLLCTCVVWQNILSFMNFAMKKKTKMCYIDIGPTVFVNFFTGTSYKQGC